MAPKIYEYTDLMKNFITPELKPMHQELCGFSEHFQFPKKNEFKLFATANSGDGHSLLKCKDMPLKLLPNLNATQYCSSTESTVYISVIYIDGNLNTFSITTISVKVPQQLFKQKTQIITLLFHNQQSKEPDSSISSHSLHKIPCKSYSVPFPMQQW